MKKFIPPRVLLLIIVASINLSRCSDVTLFKKNSDQPELTQEEMKRLALLDDSYVYPLDQTKTNALNLSAQFLDKKDGIKRRISKIVTVPSRYKIDGKTLIKTDFSISKPETPSLYVANFNKKDGYVILSADKRVPEIVAIVGSGTIDSLAHPGLRVFLSNAIMRMDEKVAEIESLRDDEIFRSMVAKLSSAITKEKAKTSKNGRTDIGCQYLRVPGARTDNACPGGCSYTTSTVPIQSVNTTTFIAPVLLSTLWEQGPPYNNLQPIGGCQVSSYNCGNNNRYYAGCVPIAEAQVVAYFKAQNDPVWQAFTSKSCQNYTPQEADLAAQLPNTIFTLYQLTTSTSMDCSGTGVSNGSSDVTQKNPMGISPGFGLVQGEWRSWNLWDIRNSLQSAKPVVIKGFTDLSCFIYCWGSGSGHQWVIDGMRDLGVQTTYQFTGYYQGEDCPNGNQVTTYTYTSNTITNTQIHQNWGWGPYAGSGPNDWYAQDYFNGFGHANYIIAYITKL